MFRISRSGKVRVLFFSKITQIQTSLENSRDLIFTKICSLNVVYEIVKRVFRVALLSLYVRIWNRIVSSSRLGRCFLSFRQNSTRFLVLHLAAGENCNATWIDVCVSFFLLLLSRRRIWGVSFGSLNLKKIGLSARGPIRCAAVPAARSKFKGTLEESHSAFATRGRYL